MGPEETLQGMTAKALEVQVTLYIREIPIEYI